VRDLNTLASETWLNDNVIDLMQVPAGRAITESRRKVAVFDTQFTKLILEQPTGKGPRYYVYEKVVGVAEKRLLDKSSLF
jgi:Ulp1 family protease